MESAKKVVNFRWEKFKLIIRHAVLKIKLMFEAVFKDNSQPVKGKSRNNHIKKSNKINGHKKG